jgi:5'-nucleotidase
VHSTSSSRRRASTYVPLASPLPMSWSSHAIFQTLVSAPAENESGTGSSTETPKPLTSAGEFNSIPAGSPAEGHNSTDSKCFEGSRSSSSHTFVSSARLWYVNAYPADAINYGLNTLAKTYLGGAPALVLTGPNVGTNTGLTIQVSGTVGAAQAGSKAGIPSVAFSGTTGSQRSYTALSAGDYSFIYADASVRFANALVAAGTPYLPSGAFLNVNYPAAGASTRCTTGASVKFVLAKVSSASVSVCGKSSPPTESTVLGTSSGCYASVSVLSASSKADASAAVYQTVATKLTSFLSCLP